MILNTIPSAEGFYMPAEFAPHQGTIIVFPEREGSWGYGAKPAQRVFCEIIKIIAQDELVWVAVSDKTQSIAETMLLPNENIKILNIPTDDSWARDIAPTFVTDGREVRGVNWRFNAWGGDFDGLYAHWEQDDAFAKKFAEISGFDIYDADPFVLEGGAVHTDGEGTLLVTESCLLSEGRNSELTGEDIEKRLCDYLGGKKVIWLPRGIFNDETNEHVDNVCAFVEPAHVVLAWTDDEKDPQFALSAACLKALENARDAAGRAIKVTKLPIPKVPVTITQHDLEGYVFEEGEDQREVGERLAASYVNFYFTNESVLVPQFGGENIESDRLAVQILETVCKGRRIVPVDAREIIIGGGNIHCITQQVPGV